MCRLAWIAIVAEDTLRDPNLWLSWNALCLLAHDAAGGLESCLLHTTQRGRYLWLSQNTLNRYVCCIHVFFY